MKPHQTGMIVDNTIETANRAAADPVENSIREVTTAYERYNRSSLELGAMLASIRHQLKPMRKWTAFLKSKRLPFSRRKAEMLIAIHERFSNTDAQTFAEMPSGWSVLYALARMSDVELKSAMASGEVTRRTTLSHAQHLAGQEPKVTFGGAESWANRVVGQLHERVRDWSDTEREAVSDKLASAAAELRDAVLV